MVGYGRLGFGSLPAVLFIEPLPDQNAENGYVTVAVLRYCQMELLIEFIGQANRHWDEGLLIDHAIPPPVLKPSSG